MEAVTSPGFRVLISFRQPIDLRGDHSMHREICYSYACKMLNSVGPRIEHFSTYPSRSDVIDAELFLALNSPYVFGGAEQDLFCYEKMQL